MGELNAQLQESLSGVRVVQAFQAEGSSSGGSRRQRGVLPFVRSRMRRIAALARPVSELGLVAVAVTMLYLGAREIFLHHSLAPHTFILFVMACWRPVSDPQPRRRERQPPAGIAAAERVFGVLDTPTVDRRAPGAQRCPDSPTGSFEDVRFAYDGETPVLTGSRSRSGAAKWWRWSAAAAPARAPRWTCSRASTIRSAAGSRSTGTTCAI
jgi:ABC-type multidrug transport system fused ATPase/permease subunit